MHRPNRNRFLVIAATVAALSAASAAHAAQVAITEFVIDPYGSDATAPEWIELFNYGADAADLTNWTIKDNSSSAFTFPSLTLPSGGYAIVTTNRTNFLNKWLGGADDPRVIGDVGFVENNSAPGDGLYLRDAGGNLVWSLGYVVDSTTAPTHPYHSTFLAIDDFSTNDYGVPPQDGTALIVRNGTDGTGTLGYEDNTETVDPYAYFSTAGTGDVEAGSPLLGGYTPVPEPASIGLLGTVALLGLARRRRTPCGPANA